MKYVLPDQINHELEVNTQMPIIIDCSGSANQTSYKVTVDYLVSTKKPHTSSA